MARITADSVIDDQLDMIYVATLRLEEIHFQSGPGGTCVVCRTPFPCETRLGVEEIKAAFVLRPGKEERRAEAEDRKVKGMCYRDPDSGRWVHAPMLHRGCILR